MKLGRFIGFNEYLRRSMVLTPNMIIGPRNCKFLNFYEVMGSGF